MNADFQDFKEQIQKIYWNMDKQESEKEL